MSTSARAHSVLPASLLEIGYVPIPLPFFFLLTTGTKCAGEIQYKLILLVLQFTLGARRAQGKRPPEWSKALTAHYLADLLDVSEEQVRSSLADAVRRGILARRRSERDARAYHYKARYEHWTEAQIPNYVRPEKPEPREASVLAPEPELAACTAPAPAQPAQPAPPEPEPLVLMPGETSRPIPLSAAVRFENRTFYPLEIGVREGAVRVQLVESLPINREIPQVDLGYFGTFPNGSNGLDPVFGPSGTAELVAQIGPAVVQRFGKPLDPTLARQILSRLGTAPPALLLERIQKDRRRKPLTSGILLHWADDARLMFEDMTKTSYPPPAPPPAPPLPPVPDDAGSTWDRIKQRAKHLVSAETYSNWFARSWHRQEARGELIVACQDEATALCLREDFSWAVDRAQAAEGLGLTIRFEVA
jgi:hypothetical protein